MPGGWAGSNRRSRLPADWDARKAAVHQRSGMRCEFVIDGRRCNRLADGGVDHIVRGDDHSLTNLRDTCHTHHSKKSSREGLEAKRRNKERAKRPPERHPGSIRRKSP